MKKRIVLIGLGVVCTLLLVGCIRIRTIRWYDLALERVERPVETKQRYGEDIFIDERTCVYEDALMRILFSTGAKSICFSVINKTDRSIKIIWDESAYIDENKSSHRVMHAGVRYISRDEPQTPSVVPAGSKLEETIYPTDSFYYDSAHGWRQKIWFPINPLGKKIGVLLAVQAERVTNQYTFIFRIVEGV